MEKTYEHINGKKANTAKRASSFSVFTDLKLLFKSFVLIANVLPTVTGFWLALYFTNSSFMDHLGTFLLTIIGSFLIIAGALSLNNWYEVDLDREMVRTKLRPTVTGNFSMRTVLVIGISTSIAGLIVLSLTTWEAALHGFLGWFTYVVLYTFWSKRKYTLNTVIGSVSGAFTPLIGWAAIDSAFHVVPITLFVILFLWQIPHTFAIAMRRFNDYRAAGVPMLPVKYGFDITKRQTFIYILCLLPTPVFLISLGIPFVIIATILNLIWIGIGIRGFFVKDNLKWANLLFIFSLNYLTILFLLMIFVTL